MVEHQQDTDNSISNAQDLRSLGKVEFDKTGIVFFYLLQGSYINESLSDLSSYLDIYFEELYKDHYNNITKTNKVHMR
jgi:hypothetical protein